MFAAGTTTTAAQQEPERERRERALRLPQQRPSGDGGGDSSTGPEGNDNDDYDDDCRDGGRSDESTQFGGASAEWSDTASDASDASVCGGDGGGGGGGGGGGDAISSSPDANGSSSSCRSGRSSRTGDVARRRRKPKAIAATHTGPGYNDNAAAAARMRERRRRRRRGVGEEGAAEGGSRSNEGNGSDAGYAQDVDSTTSPSDSDNDSDNDGSGGSSSSSDGDADAEDPLEPIPGEVKLVPSMFPDRSPTVFFEYPKELGMARFNNVYFSEPLGSRRLLFKCHWERNSVKNAFFRAGFSRTRSTMSWTASWGKHPTREGFRNLNRFQKINHFPGSWCIGRKDRLMRTLARHKREMNGAAAAAAVAAAATAPASGGVQKGGGSVGGGGGGGGYRSGGGAAEGPAAGSLVDITPDGFVLPGDRRAWLKAVEAEPRAIWIVKPPASSCGRGIRVINKGGVGGVSKSKKGLVQEGLVRFSTKRYSLRNLRSRFTHLTNYSINKKSGSFQGPDNSDGQEAKESTTASKWALTFFWKYLEKALGKKKSDEVQRSIEDVVLRTMVAADGDMTTHSHQFTRHRGCCYELFGFDVLLDEALKPWLLEVNISPSLFGSSALDRRIKGTLMADIFHLVGFRPFDRMALRREERREAKHIPGTRRAVRAVAGRPQDAWRRCQTPASINLGELGEEEWEVIRDTEDEQARRLYMCHGHRAGHFRVLYPTAENVTRLWPMFRSPRFLNGVLARWVLTGGLTNPTNRQDIGLIAERLATLAKSQGGKGLSSTGSGVIAGGGSKGPKGKGRGLWEETTSNATTVVATRGGGVARLGDELPGSLPWSGSGGERPASSATSRASRPPAARRPPCRASAAAVPSTAATAKVAAAAAAGGHAAADAPAAAWQ
ncbi:unnamed protein product [Ectocarpus sp. 6 AP-2014]